MRRGEYRALSRVTFSEYAAEWIDGYQGRTSRGIRPETVAEYRRALGLDGQGNPTGGGATAFFGRMQLTAIEARDVKRYAASVSAKGVSANTVRLALAPVKALLATAQEEGVIRWNPAAGVRMATRPQGEGGQEVERPKALTPDELLRLLDAVRPQQRLLAEFLALTGLRISEAVALRWSDIDLTDRRVSVRRRYYRGGYASPKSRYGQRDVRLSPGLAQQLGALWRTHRKGGEALVFPGRDGAPVDASTVFRAVKAAAVTTGVPWAGLHTLRHTCASLLFARGLNAKQIQRWLGHHRASFTIDTYVHLLDEELPEAVDLPTRSISAATQRVLSNASASLSASHTRL